MIRHAAVNIVLDVSFLSRISQRFADSHLVAPRDCIDECFVSPREELCYELFVFERALDEGDILKGFKFFGNRRCRMSDMGSNLIPTRLSASP